MDEKELIKALRNTDSYDEKAEGKIELVQTYISYVFLTGRFVYKVKKAVNFEYLDFSTLEKRKFFCDEELRLNRRLCPEIYLEVVPINKSNGRIKIKGAGNVVEYAVKMRQLPPEAIMTMLFGCNKVTEKHMVKLANILARFHSEAETGPEISKYGALEKIKANCDQNFRQTGHVRGLLVDAAAYDMIIAKTNDFFLKNRELFEQRIRDDKIRECHGDVHSGNIFIVQDKIYVFDAIEFNKAFRCIDVAAEVAFMAMDLDFHGKPHLSDVFVEKYVKYSNDYELLGLISFYKCYYAYVRAKVIGFKLDDPNICGEEKEEARESAKKYYVLAHGYAKEL